MTYHRKNSIEKSLFVQSTQSRHIDGLCESNVKWALERLRLSDYTAYASDAGWVYYDDIGIYPREDAFSEKAKSYDSYLYRTEK